MGKKVKVGDKASEVPAAALVQVAVQRSEADGSLAMELLMGLRGRLQARMVTNTSSSLKNDE